MYQHPTLSLHLSCLSVCTDSSSATDMYKKPVQPLFSNVIYCIYTLLLLFKRSKEWMNGPTRASINRIEFAVKSAHNSENIPSAELHCCCTVSHTIHSVTH